MTVSSAASTQQLPPGPAAPAKRGGAVGLLSRLGPLIGLIFVLALFSILRPRTFPTVENFQLMLMQTAVVGTAALGATIIIISGGIDLSVGSNIALVTVVVAMMLNAGYSPLISAAGGVGAAMIVGLVIGALVTGLKPPFFLTAFLQRLYPVPVIGRMTRFILVFTTSPLPPFIVTLGLWGAVRGVAKEVSGQTVVPCPDSWLDVLLQTLTPSQKWMLAPPGVWLLIVMTIVVVAMLRYTRFGRHVFAVGSNEQTARLCGVRINRTKLLVYLTATFLAGLAGVLQFSYLTVGDPTTADGMELNIIAAVVIGGASLNGGQGSAVGSILGALIMTAVADGCTKLELSNSVQEIVTGAIIILAVKLDSVRHQQKT
jgi:ribose transport system permease protein